MLIDDHPMFLDALGAAVVQKFPNFTVTPVGSILDARNELSGGFVPTLAVVDINLPDGDGVELIKELHDDYGVKIIAFSGNESRIAINACLKGGASAFVSKSSDTCVFFEAIEAVLAGEQQFPPLTRNTCAPHVGMEITLTKRQQDVLDLIVLGYPNKTIAQSLELTEGTVKNHASNLHTIFGTTSRHELVVKARLLRFGK